MERFFRQTDGFRCGPIAVANVYRLIGKKDFAGERLTRKIINKYITDAVGCTKHGVSEKNVFRFLETSVRYCNCTAKRIKRLTMRQLDTALNKGYSVVLSIDDFKGGHIFIINGRTSKSYRCINCCYGDLDEYYSRSFIRKVFKTHRKYTYKNNTMALLIKRNIDE